MLKNTCYIRFVRSIFNFCTTVRSIYWKWQWKYRFTKNSGIL